MAKRQGWTAERKTELVLRLLRKEEPAAQGGLHGEATQLRAQVAERDQVIGGLTVPNRLFFAVSAGL